MNHIDLLIGTIGQAEGSNPGLLRKSYLTSKGVQSLTIMIPFLFESHL